MTLTTTESRWRPGRRAGRVAVAGAVASATMLLAPLAAQAGLVQFWDEFESTRHPGWTATGGAGFDYNRGLSHNGVGNAWVRNTTGWNAVNTVVQVQPNSDCVASAWLRLSDRLTAGYMSVRRWNGQPGPVINEIKLVGPGPGNPDNKNYNQYQFHFDPATPEACCSTLGCGDMASTHGSRWMTS